MYVEIDQNSGFCFGVVRAISRAESALEALGGEVYSLGDIVHNRMEVQRLESLGLRTVNHEDMESLSGRDLFIRAHGEPPTTFRRAEELGIRVIDATCPVVAQLQHKVVAAYEKMKNVGGQVVILGKRGHAEVVGLTGQVDDQVIVIEREEDLRLINFSAPVFFLSQTTQSIGLFWHLAERMKELIEDESMLTVNDTICRRVSNREKALREFAERFDVVIFVCGKKSSNGKVLFDVCRGANPRSYNIEEESELQAEWFEGCQSVGICGATSTPAWLMSRVAEAIERKFR
ncbi:MAG: 4-hydroxy-3-methylbut-2-enyl diphosphate reductase [Alistipes sp.]|jgi:4-hydroxy-3-methylbut-2-enyl diphosphate reductase|nr:4-hydroxy-3-methylbut-2-enyl diphosphate reductase [Alistipes sp.]MBQ2415396.1 4-hydroxy-3-methylbut-2-enyl diphosphate reductase [Alistipes sp.]MBQ5624022.1 4-hydroxy-3-methylbut-2-enyl diphosphate reductase [Alistipes sp.]MBQ5786211.1 4-hydroxy-3-methylbut-2-enyl diphosphate reductase [Alistipes sp.]MBQ5914317.1 4-hydroxy-3-methylbut-2-enyl diphosphate reductase [Alistipes sp.]